LLINFDKYLLKPSLVVKKIGVKFLIFYLERFYLDKKENNKRKENMLNVL
jgi:hypothetical protein